MAVALALGACGGKSKGPETTAGTGSADTRSLYDRIGGTDGITGVVDDFLANVAADARINAMFANADLKNLRTKLIEQICEASGGPCKYSGKSMKESHTGMGVTEDHFTALVEDLVKSLDKIGVKDPEKSELLGALGGMKGDIVEKK
jgi:hemoglobin